MKNFNKIADFARKSFYLNTNLLICDNNLLEIENCKKVLEYNDIYLKLLTSTLILEIWGNDLSISDYSTDGVVVKGNIKSIEFMKR